MIRTPNGEREDFRLSQRIDSAQHDFMQFSRSQQIGALIVLALLGVLLAFKSC